MNRFILFLIAIFHLNTFYSQAPQIIRVKKTDDSFYFFQKGNSTDTLSQTKGNAFYLIVKGKLRDRLIIDVENGQLLKTANDSVFKFHYIKGITYECFFEKVIAGVPLEKRIKNKNTVTVAYEFKCLINGVSNEEKNNILFRFKTKGDSEYFLENKFYFRE